MKFIVIDLVIILGLSKIYLTNGVRVSINIGESFEVIRSVFLTQPKLPEHSLFW